MLAARLYGARDIRIDEVPAPPPPGSGEVLIDVAAVGICGSDLHTYEDGRIGDTQVQSPVVMGHEFAGVVRATGPEAWDGLHQRLAVGQRVAVEPTVSCWHCENCENGHPNLCPNHHFLGLWPHDGALQRQLVVPARNCFPYPDSLSDAAGALLEPLGVAMHAVDLGKLKVARSVMILGCGPIGLLILRLARLSGADPIYAFDRFPWRVEKAKAWGATDAWTLDAGDPAAIVAEQTHGRGVDVAFEVAWGGEAILQAAEGARLGGRVVLVGIPGDNDLYMRHSTVRRKGLTIMMTRRMKHTYPRAIHLTTNFPQPINLDELVSHRFALSETGKAFATNVAYEPGVFKVVVDVQK